MAIVAALIVVAVILFFMYSETPQRVAIADLEDDASSIAGASVTVEGEVDETLSEQALTMRDGESDEPLLVVVHASTIIDGVVPVVDEMDVGAEQPVSGEVDRVEPVAEPDLIAPAIRSSGPIRVMGTVDTFDRAALSEQLGITVGGEDFAPFDGGPYVLADQIETDFDPSTIPPDESPVASAAS